MEDSSVCPECKGKGYITLLYSTVECTCCKRPKKTNKITQSFIDSCKGDTVFNTNGKWDIWWRLRKTIGYEIY